MPIRSTTDLQPGMVVAADIQDPNGRLIVPAGTTLTDRHIKALKMWGIGQVNIAGEAKESGSEQAVTIDPAIAEAAKNYVKALYRLHGDEVNHPLLNKLVRLSHHKTVQRFSRRPEAVADAWSRFEAPPSVQDKPGVVSRRPTLDGLVQRATTVSSLPAIYDRLMSVIHHPHSSAEDIAKVISEDTGLTARLLRIVNSSFYGFPARIDTISRAITIVGTTQLSELALSTSVATLFNRIPGTLVSIDSFWQHSVACGIVARGLGTLRRESNLERLFIGGLLHDIGRAVLFVYHGEAEQTAMLTAHERKVPLFNAERLEYEFDHADVGAELLAHWNLPEIHRELVGRHHRPGAATKFPTETAIIHVADVITHAMGWGTTGEKLVPRLAPDAWERLGLSPEALPEMLQKTEREVDEMIAILSA